jgi:hypothetical protein
MIRRSGFGCALLLSALVTVSCGVDTEDARLRKQVNVTPTHLYAALKIAASAKDGNEDAKRVRHLLKELESGLSKAQGTLGPDAKVDVVALAEVVTALWRLRNAGQSEVERWQNSELSVLGPEALTGVSEAQRPSVEHAVLLLALMVMKFDPHSPSPVPPEVVLYEAYLMEGVARSVQSIVYARETYCDFAGQGTQRLTQVPLVTNGSELRRLAELAVGLGPAAAHVPSGAVLVAVMILVENLPWASRLLAHAATAQCFQQSALPDGRQRSLVEWDRAVEVAAGVGFPPEELAFLRAYLAYQREDFATVQQQLTLARSSRLLNAEERKQLDQLVQHFDPKDRGAIDQFLDPLFVSRWMALLVHHRLQAAGFYRALGEVPALRVVSEVFAAAALPDGKQLEAAGSRGWHWLQTAWHWFRDPDESHEGGETTAP